MKVFFLWSVRAENSRLFRDTAIWLTTVVRLAMPSQGLSQVEPIFSSESAEAAMDEQTTENFEILKQSNMFPVWAPMIESAVSRTAEKPTVKLSYDERERILCSSKKSKGVAFTKCDDTTAKAEFAGLEALQLRMAFTIWSDPPNRGTFVRWFLSDLLIYALERQSGAEVRVINGQFAFDDNLLDSYFQSRLTGSDLVAIASKVFSVPNAVVVGSDGWIQSSGDLTGDFPKLILGSFFRNRGLIVDRSPFSERIGPYSFQTQLLFLDVSARYGYEAAPIHFAQTLLATIIDAVVRVDRWLAWAELFAFPALNSPRNVEYWRDLIPLKSINSEPVRRYVDLEQRPGANPVSKSSAEFSIINRFESAIAVEQPRIEFRGELGAIPSERDAGSYVGFTGVEIKSGVPEVVRSCQSSRPGDNGERVFEFDILLRGERARRLTVELVVDRKGELVPYASDFNLQPGQNAIVAKLSDFKKSFRGRTSDETPKETEKIVSYRFFFKRSLNEPASSQLLPVEFSIQKQFVGLPGCSL